MALIGMKTRISQFSCRKFTYLITETFEYEYFLLLFRLDITYIMLTSLPMIT